MFNWIWGKGGKFYSGQEVQGVIKLHNNKLREIAGVFLIIEGKAQTQWSETEGTGERRRSVTYGGTQQLIFTTVSLIEGS